MKKEDSLSSPTWQGMNDQERDIYGNLCQDETSREKGTIIGATDMQ